jgi:hypothetical protein
MCMVHNAAPPSCLPSLQELMRQQLEEAKGQLAAARRAAVAQIRRAALQLPAGAGGGAGEGAGGCPGGQAAAVEAASGQHVADGLAQHKPRWPAGGGGGPSSARWLFELLVIHASAGAAPSQHCSIHSTVCGVAH